MSLALFAALKILAYVAAVLVGAALLAPPLYWAGRWAVDSHFILALEPFPFFRYFNRAVLLLALGLLWPFGRWLGVGNWRTLGLEPNARRWRHLGAGVALGLLGLWVVAAVLLLLGRAEIRANIAWLKVAGALGTAVAVPIIEEIFFRAALLGVLRRHLSWPKALLFLSLIFATLHFAKPHPAVRQITEIGWLSGFELVPYMFWQFSEPQLIVGQWLTLFLVGCTLGYSVVLTRSLYFAIGLHGGWVFAMRSFMFASHSQGEPSWWLGADLMTGFLPLLLVGGSLAVVWWLYGRQQADSSGFKPQQIAEPPTHLG